MNKMGRTIHGLSLFGAWLFALEDMLLPERHARRPARVNT